MPKDVTKIIFRIISVTGLLFCGIWSIYGYRTGLFTSTKALQNYIAGFGAAGPLIFMLVQVLQVVVPVFPGGVSCIVGVLLFGPWFGFLYNYIGISLGSVCAFALAKRFGRPIMEHLFSDKTIEKYEAWTEKRNRFPKLLALAIVLPGLPDDFLCYLAGMTKISWKYFVAITLLGRPVALVAYSLGLNTIIA